jgi:hypothetical protein
LIGVINNPETSLEIYMTDLLREAIADAKAVREVALANAKMALEEAFTPRIQSMISTKLSEEAEGEDEEMEEGWNESEEVAEGEEDYSDDETMPEESDDEDMDSDDDESEEESVEEEYGNDWFEEEPGMAEGEGMEDDSSMEEGEGEDEEPMDEDLMEIIRQLEEELDSSEIGKGDNKQPSKYASDDHTEDKKEKIVQLVEEEEEEEMHEGEDIDDADIQEIINALREEEEEEEMHEGEETEEPKETHHEMEENLQEAYAVIKFLREKLNEVNLLNSKLLFSNKLFRSHSLTESQKMTVIENFDRAGSLREVKLVYATLAEALKGQTSKKPSAPKKSLKESFNRIASKPQASTRPSKKILTESDQVADRFKKLAGLI